MAHQEAKDSEFKDTLGGAAVTHNEFASQRRNSTALELQTTIEYDHVGPMGIFRSPYVFGAALVP
jgi:hypothetical protein